MACWSLVGGGQGGLDAPPGGGDWFEVDEPRSVGDSVLDALEVAEDSVKVCLSLNDVFFFFFFFPFFRLFLALACDFVLPFPPLRGCCGRVTCDRVDRVMQCKSIWWCTRE